MAFSHVDQLTVQTNTPSPCVHQIRIGDLDISGACRGAVIALDAGQLPKVTLDLLVIRDDTPIDGPAVVIVPDDTATALVALGWTPPSAQDGEQAEACACDLRAPEHRPDPTCPIHGEQAEDGR